MIYLDTFFPDKSFGRYELDSLLEKPCETLVDLFIKYTLIIQHLDKIPEFIDKTTLERLKDFYNKKIALFFTEGKDIFLAEEEKNSSYWIKVYTSDKGLYYAYRGNIDGDFDVYCYDEYRFTISYPALTIGNKIEVIKVKFNAVNMIEAFYEHAINSYWAIKYNILPITESLDEFRGEYYSTHDTESLLKNCSDIILHSSFYGTIDKFYLIDDICNIITDILKKAILKSRINNSELTANNSFDYSSAPKDYRTFKEDDCNLCWRYGNEGIYEAEPLDKNKIGVNNEDYFYPFCIVFKKNI